MFKESKVGDGGEGEGWKMRDAGEGWRVRDAGEGWRVRDGR